MTDDVCVQWSCSVRKMVDIEEKVGQLVMHGALKVRK